MVDLPLPLEPPPGGWEGAQQRGSQGAYVVQGQSVWLCFCVEVYLFVPFISVANLSYAIVLPKHTRTHARAHASPLPLSLHPPPQVWSGAAAAAVT